MPLLRPLADIQFQRAYALATGLIRAPGGNAQPTQCLPVADLFRRWFPWVSTGRADHFPYLGNDQTDLIADTLSFIGGKHTEFEKYGHNPLLLCVSSTYANPTHPATYADNQSFYPIFPSGILGWKTFQKSGLSLVLNPAHWLYVNLPLSGYAQYRLGQG